MITGDLSRNREGMAAVELLRPGWCPAASDRSAGSLIVSGLHWALLGDTADDGGAQVLRALAATGIRVERVPDIAALPVVPELLLIPCVSAAGSRPPDAARTMVHRMIGLLQRWAADQRLHAMRLAVLTIGAVATTPVEPLGDLAAAAVTGLIRCAQWEHPGRLMLVDVDRAASSYRALAAVVRLGRRETAVRNGTVLVPVLDATGCRTGARPRALDPEGTVLITGGTGIVGGLTARRLVTRHGARHLLLASRRGTRAEGTSRLAAGLRGLGAEVTIIACDAAEPDSLGRLLADVPARHPVNAIVHAAGVADDATIRTLSPERIDAVLLPKIAGAWNLHRLTAGLDLSAFVLYSSVFGVIGNAGQGSYCAASAFVNALAHHRRLEGSPALSLAWGWWAQPTPMTRHMDQRLGARLARCGIYPIGTEHGLALLDAALASADDPVLVTGDFDLAKVRQAHREARPTRHPVRTSAPRQQASGDLGPLITKGEQR